jgi:hypothetical protein
MTRLVTIMGALLLALGSPAMSALAQEGVPVNADGSYVVANDDGVPIVSGAGDDIVYGDINTGGGGGEVLGDPSAVYSPNVPDNPGPNGGVPVIAGAGDGLIGGAPIRPAAPDSTTTTTTSLATSEGSATENIPVDALAPEAAAPAPTDSGTAPIGFCAQYTAWYDAQIAYENLGATAADPALVQEVDSDYDGIACEGLMV